MAEKIRFDVSKMIDPSILNKNVSEAYKKHDKVKFIFDVTNVSMKDAQNINNIMAIVDRHKNDTHKLESIDIVCPKSHRLKRELVKKCVKIAKVEKPTYLVEK